VDRYGKDLPGAVRDEEFLVAGLAGDGEPFPRARHLLGIGVVELPARLDVVAADRTARAGEPDPAAVVGDVQTAELVASNVRAVLDDYLPAVAAIGDDDAAVTDRVGAGDGAYDFEEIVREGRFDGFPLRFVRIGAEFPHATHGNGSAGINSVGVLIFRSIHGETTRDPDGCAFTAPAVAVQSSS